MITTLKVGGMTCDNCARHVAEALEGVPGVERAFVELGSGIAKVEGDADPEALVAAVREEDYEAELV